MKDVMTDMANTNIRKMLHECVRKIRNTTSGRVPIGISSGIPPLDDFIGGLERDKLYVIGGRPCMGKEELMLSMIRNISLKSNVPVLMFSTQHKKLAYTYRLLSIHCGISTSDLHQAHLGKDEWWEIEKGVTSLEKSPLYIHDSLYLPLDELGETIKDCIKEGNISIIFIDCLQMIEFARGSETPSVQCRPEMSNIERE